MRVTLCLDVLCESCEKKNRSWFSPRVRFIDLFIYSFIWLALTLNARNGQIITRNLLFCTQYKRALRSLLLPCVYLRVFVPVDRLPFFVHAHSHRSSLILCDTKSALHLRLSGSSQWDFYVLDHFLLSSPSSGLVWLFSICLGSFVSRWSRSRARASRSALNGEQKKNSRASQPSAGLNRWL